MSSDIKVYVTDAYHPAGPSLLCKHFNVILHTDPQFPSWPDEATAIMVRSNPISAVDIARSKKLKLIVKQGVGMDNLPLELCKEKGILCCNTPAMNADSVAELTIALALGVSRRVVEMDALIKAGKKLIRSNYLGMTLQGKTVGVVGMGNIGRLVAKKFLAAFDCKILAFDPFVSEGAWPDIPHIRTADFESLLPQVDILTLHVPLVQGTKHMISTAQFNKMKSTAILINCARGGVVEESALVKALQEGKIYGAGLDAFESEPPTIERYEVLMKERVICLPHAGAGTVENQSKSSESVAEIVIGFLERGEVMNRVI